MPFGSVTCFERTLRGLAFAAALVLPVASQAGEVRFNGEGHAENPAWSKDGKYLAFEVNRFEGDIDMYFAEMNGDISKDSMQVKLPGASSGFSSSDQVVMDATWHQDGIAVFEGSNKGGQLRLYYAAPGGSVAAEMLPTTKAPGGLSFPTISPDGNSLAFISDQTGNGDVRTWDRSTDNLNQLTATPVSESFPSYSADGKKLLFTRKENNSLSIYQEDIATKSEKQLASGAGDETRPVYAADGSIVFFSAGKTEGHWDLKAINGDGSNLHMLAEGIRLPIRARPALTPDGKWVAFAYDDPTKANKIVLETIDGSKTIEVPSKYVACGEPAIGLQNGRILLAYTALPSADADWRFLDVVDITDKF